MLFVGTIQNLQTTNNTVVYNFSSLNQMYPRLHLLPPFEIGYKSDYDFDIKYANYIMSNDIVFFDFMQIVYSLYMGKDVFLLINDDEEYELLNESLMKFIQQRYGITAVYITCMEDLMYAQDTGFSAIGKLNIQQDKERLAILAEKLRLRAETGGM